jgi:DNA ligase-1
MSGRSITSFFALGAASSKPAASAASDSTKRASNTANVKADAIKKQKLETPHKSEHNKDQEKQTPPDTKEKQSKAKPPSLSSFFAPRIGVKSEGKKSEPKKDAKPIKKAEPLKADPMEVDTEPKEKQTVKAELQKPPVKVQKSGKIKLSGVNDFDVEDYAQWKAGEDVPYQALAEVFEKIDSISSRLDIQTHMTKLFRAILILTPKDLAACMFLACNKLASAYDNVEIGIGDAILIKAVEQATGSTAKHIKTQYKEVGDLGSVAQNNRGKQKTLGFGAKPKPLTIAGVLKTLREIASVKGNSSQDRKITHIKKMLTACQQKGFEAKFIIRQCQGKLRIGLAENTVLVALAHALVRSPAKPEHQQPGRPPLSITDGAHAIINHQWMPLSITNGRSSPNHQ